MARRPKRRSTLPRRAAVAVGAAATRCYACTGRRQGGTERAAVHGIILSFLRVVAGRIISGTRRQASREAAKSSCRWRSCGDRSDGRTAAVAFADAPGIAARAPRTRHTMADRTGRCRHDAIAGASIVHAATATAMADVGEARDRRRWCPGAGVAAAAEADSTRWRGGRITCSVRLCVSPPPLGPARPSCRAAPQHGPTRRRGCEQRGRRRRTAPATSASAVDRDRRRRWD